MSCCCFSGSDADGPEFSVENHPKAAKSHKCCECTREIKPGEEYHNVKGVWDGEFRTYKTCLGCYLMRLDMSCDGTYEFEALRENIWYCLGFDYVTGEWEEE